MASPLHVCLLSRIWASHQLIKSPKFLKFKRIFICWSHSSSSELVSLEHGVLAMWTLRLSLIAVYTEYARMLSSPWAKMCSIPYSFAATFLSRQPHYHYIASLLVTHSLIRIHQFWNSEVVSGHVYTEVMLAAVYTELQLPIASVTAITPASVTGMTVASITWS